MGSFPVKTDGLNTRRTSHSSQPARRSQLSRKLRLLLQGCEALVSRCRDGPFPTSACGNFARNLALLRILSRPSTRGRLEGRRYYRIDAPCEQGSRCKTQDEQGDNQDYRGWNERTETPSPPCLKARSVSIHSFF